MVLFSKKSTTSDPDLWTPSVQSMSTYLIDRPLMIILGKHLWTLYWQTLKIGFKEDLEWTERIIFCQFHYGAKAFWQQLTLKLN